MFEYAENRFDKHVTKTAIDGFDLRNMVTPTWAAGRSGPGKRHDTTNVFWLLCPYGKLGLFPRRELADPPGDLDA